YYSFTLFLLSFPTRRSSDLLLLFLLLLLILLVIQAATHLSLLSRLRFLARYRFLILLCQMALQGRIIVFSLTQPAALARTHGTRSEEHTSELQSRFDLVCRL